MNEVSNLISDMFIIVIPRGHSITKRTQAGSKVWVKTPKMSLQGQRCYENAKVIINILKVQS